LLDADVDFVARSGAHVEGREAFRSALEGAFRTRYGGSVRTTRETKLTFIGTDVALLRGDWTVERVRGPDGGLLDPQHGRLLLDPQHGRLLLVLEREGAAWVVVAGQNTNVPHP
jgi:ketosteroid isomerase-like protein